MERIGNVCRVDNLKGFKKGGNLADENSWESSSFTKLLLEIFVYRRVRDVSSKPQGQPFPSSPFCQNRHGPHFDDEVSHRQGQAL